MADALLIVEGAHDAAFFGLLAERQAFSLVKKKSDIPNQWVQLIPVRFPPPRKPGESISDDLSHIVNYPDIYISPTGSVLGIVVAGGDSALVKELRKSYEALGPETVGRVAVVLDADWVEAPSDRFRKVVGQLEALNKQASGEGETGFPLPLPDRPGEFSEGVPRLGIFVFPNNREQGTLETILLACAANAHSAVSAAASGYISQVSSLAPSPGKFADDLKKTSSREKATAGAISSVYNPRAALAVAIRDGAWRLDGHLDLPALETFVRTLLNG